MLEIPEALTIAKQINMTIKARKIVDAVANHSPHKFAWYHGDPQGYKDILKGNTIINAAAYGGLVHIQLDSSEILIGDGTNLRYHSPEQKVPTKHQLLLELDDSSKVTASIQMYGGIWCFNNEYDKKEDKFENIYFNIAKEKPSPLSDEFDEAYFEKLISSPDVQKMSAKAFLATEQRIPGLGNGVLQDILWEANINPRSKINTLKEEQKFELFRAIKFVLSKMAEHNGRDTEKDFFGNNGGYKTIMSKNNVNHPCPRCGTIIKKENYYGGSIYYCEKCQPIQK